MPASHRKILTVPVLLLLMLLMGLTLYPVHAQEDDNSRRYTFSTGLVVEVPPSWQLDADPITRDRVLLLRGADVLTARLVTVAEQQALDAEGDVAALLPQVFPTALGNLVIAPNNLRREQLADGRAILSYVYGRNAIAYASFTRSGDVLIILNPVRRTETDIAALLLLDTMQEPLPPPATSTATVTALPPPPSATPTPTPTRTPTPIPSIARDDDTPLELPTPRIITTSSVVFSDGTRLRFPANWDATFNEDVRDLAVLAVDTALIYADLYRAFDFQDLELSGVGAVMAYSYVPFSAQGAFDARAVQAFTPEGSDITIRYWRYVDGGFSGTQMAAQLPNGSILVLDAFDVEPNSMTEAAAFAMLLDAAGDASLLEAGLRSTDPAAGEVSRD
jgi:hypothetical protein